MKRPTAAMITLGCKVNQYESEAIAERLVSLGFDVVPADGSRGAADIFIVNTCAVTAESERKSRQMIRRASKGAGDAPVPVIVCGCLSQSIPEDTAAIDGVAVVIGNSGKLRAADEALDIIKNGAPASPRILTDAGSIASVLDIEEMSISKVPRTRAYVKICDGCDGKCAYCLIPSMRGHVRSRSSDSVIDEVETLARGGCREVVLTGIETAAYGRDTGDSLVSLLRRVGAIDGIERIRLGSLEPTVITPDFAAAATEIKALVPHYHLSLQSGCSRTLAAMRRKYTAESAMARIESLRAVIPDVMFTTDMIVGFPGETDEDFEETLAFVRRARFLLMHVFPFSRRRGTAADTMPDQVSAAVKHERSARLIAEGQEIRQRLVDDYAARAGVVPVLFESDDDGMHTGRTANFVEVRTPLCGVRQGEIRQVRLVSARGGVAYGEVVR